MTARPLVFYVIQRRLESESRGSATDDWKEGLSQNTVAVIDSCITAARATTVIMDAAAKHNLIGNLPRRILLAATNLNQQPTATSMGNTHSQPPFSS